MIKIFYQEDIIKRLAAVITYGLNMKYSCKSIEEHIVSSSFIVDLENNKYDIESSIEMVVESTFAIKLKCEADISFRGLFFAESYFRLFLYFNKSFEYLFLYWPLANFVDKYNIYHEMDFSNLREDFTHEINKVTLLKKIAKDRKISLSNVSKLTGINENTIDRYSRDDKYLYSASFENIYKLAKLFDVKSNLFVSCLNFYLDQTIYLADETNEDFKNYLGLYYAGYFDSRINVDDMVYHKEFGCFLSKDNKFKIVVTTKDKNEISNDMINSISDKDTYVVIFPTGFYYGFSSYENVDEINAIDVMLVTQEDVFIVKKEVKKEITDTISRSLIILANSKAKVA